jgi:hypothetical protein
MRFAAMTVSAVTDLDQITTATGGLITLLFSLHVAFKERRKSRNIAGSSKKGRRNKHH